MAHEFVGLILPLLNPRQDATFLAIRHAGEDSVASTIPPSCAVASTSAVGAAAAGRLDTMASLPTSVQVVSPTDPGPSYEILPRAAAGQELALPELATALNHQSTGLRVSYHTLSSTSSPPSSAVAMAVEAAARAGFVGSHRSRNSSQVLLNGPAPSGAVAVAIEAAARGFLAGRVLAPPDPIAGALSSTINRQQHHVQPNTIGPTERHGGVAAQEAGRGEEGGGTGPDRVLSSPAAAGESSRGVSNDGGGKETHKHAATPSESSEGKECCCEACDKVFIPSLRPSFCCRTCHKLFHGDCAGYSRHKRQCPPPDWICPCCPNGERGPTEYDIHSSLRGMGTVTQKLGNQLWCPICLEDDRAPGSTKNDPGSKKCLGCGLRAHGHCISGLEAWPEGRWPCHECRRRRDSVISGHDSPRGPRLKMARLDGGRTSTLSTVSHGKGVDI